MIYIKCAFVIPQLWPKDDLSILTIKEIKQKKCLYAVSGNIYKLYGYS